MPAPSLAWGPFSPGLAPAERLAQLRTLRALAHVLCGPRAASVEQALRAAERDPAALPAASAEIDRMPSLDRRRVLATFGAIR